MDENDLTAISKQLSWLLRHGANQEKLTMDAAGWAKIDEVLRVSRIRRDVLDQVVDENTKSRLQVDGDRIRACQGHSLKGTPVTVDALEASWTEWVSTDSLWHGTSCEAALEIAKGAIEPMDRSHVHLADATDAKVGKRSGVALMIEVSPSRLREQGIRVFQSQNGVLLVRRVPANCVVGVTAETKRGGTMVDKVRAAFGLS